MPSVSRSALVGFSANDMFDLVNDVAAYPQFLPGCADSKVLEANESSMKAALLIQKAGVQQWFTTHNQLTSGREIAMQLVDGPFKQLSGGWTFTPLNESACKIELNLQFEFANKLVALAFGRVFNNIANSMVQAFTERAKGVFGDR